jgi:exportin-1
VDHVLAVFFSPSTMLLFDSPEWYVGELFVAAANSSDPFAPHQIYANSCTILRLACVVLCDSFHRPGFRLHASILIALFNAVGSGHVTEPVWNQSVPEEQALASNNGTLTPSNVVYLRNHLTKILSTAFPNLSAGQVSEVVKGLLSGADEKTFKSHLRDFLVQTKEFSAGDNTDLYDEEKQALLAEQQQKEAERLARTPGLVGPQAGVDDGMNA